MQNNNHLNESQWGSRPGRSTEEALIHKISYEISAHQDSTRYSRQRRQGVLRPYNHAIRITPLPETWRSSVGMQAERQALIAAKYAIRDGPESLKELTRQLSINRPMDQAKADKHPRWMV
jgi:hypothetical protein